MSLNNINFIASLQPLDAGDYLLQVQQTMTGTGLNTGTYFSTPTTQSFYVDAPQFILPADQIGPVLPAANMVGDYAWVLPQIQLNGATLPWARAASPQNTNAPWLALIVLRDDELVWNTATNSPIFPTTVGQLTATPQPTGYFFPPLTASCKREAATDPVQTMRMSKTVFSAVMPRQAEIAQLLHCRDLVPVAGDAQGDRARQVAMATANRFPSPMYNGRNHCFLVSLEGYYDYLTPSPVFPNDPQGTQPVQLVVLNYWSFVTTAGVGAGFSAGLPKNIAQAASLLLRVPATTGGRNVSVDTRLQNGYVPFEYATGLGAVTYAWYRGPLSPVLAPALPLVASELPTSDAAMIYAEGEGVFDLSYAAAWQMGRALALADTRFAMDLLAYRTAAYRVLGLLMERLRIGGFADLDDLHAILDSNAVYNAFDAMIAEGIADSIGSISATGIPLQTAPAQPLETPASPTPPVVATQQFLQQPAVVEALATLTESDLLPVAAWLAQLQMLCKVPFSHLVPDERMLPQNTVRFFYLDQNWLDCLVAGAKSVGLESSLDTFFYAAMRGVIDDAVQQVFQTYVLNLAGTATGDIAPSSSKEVMTGLLIRSTLVTSYPNLRVNAYKSSNGDPKGIALKLVRKEKLSDTVMLAIFMDVPELVEIAEPSVGLTMGTEEDGTIYLKSTQGSTIGTRSGTRFPSGGSFATYYRNGSATVGDRVLNITTLCNDLQHDLRMTTFLSSDLALQLLQSPEYFSYSIHPNPVPHA
jgi:hypothetical protein